MIKIRKNVFETNSSSTHAMCVCTEKMPIDMFKGQTLNFQFGDFGWEFFEYYFSGDKANYVYTLAHNFDDLEEFENKVYQWGQEEGINVVFNSLEDSDCEIGYVDHGTEAEDFYNYITSSKEVFFNFIYNPKSFIITGNDNSDEYNEDSFNIQVGYPHLAFYKGN